MRLVRFYRLPLLVLSFYAYFCDSTPQLDTSAANLTLTEGTTAILPCQVYDLDENNYMISWRRKSNGRTTPISLGVRTIISDRRFSISRPYSEDWNLHIQRLRRTDNGIYYCEVIGPTTHRKRIQLSVQVPPRIRASGNTELNVGETLVIFCNVSGFPKPSVQWYRDGEQLSFFGEMLRISNISQSEGGTYRCLAFNNVEPKDEDDITVNVLYPPTVHLHNANIKQRRGKDAVLECQVTANPHNVAVWTKDDRNLTESSFKYEVVVINLDDAGHLIKLRLTIRSLEKRDFGTYKCVARNKLGEDEITMELKEMDAFQTQPPEVQTNRQNLPKPRPTTNTDVRYTTYTVDQSGGEPVITIPVGSQDESVLLEKPENAADSLIFSRAIVPTFLIVYVLC